MLSSVYFGGKLWRCKGGFEGSCGVYQALLERDVYRMTNGQMRQGQGDVLGHLPFRGHA